MKLEPTQINLNKADGAEIDERFSLKSRGEYPYLVRTIPRLTAASPPVLVAFLRAAYAAQEGHEPSCTTMEIIQKYTKSNVVVASGRCYEVTGCCPEPGRSGWTTMSGLDECPLAGIPTGHLTIEWVPGALAVYAAGHRVVQRSMRKGATPATLSAVVATLVARSESAEIEDATGLDVYGQLASDSVRIRLTGFNPEPALLTSGPVSQFSGFDHFGTALEL